LRAEVQKLSNADAVGAAELKAMVAGLEGDFDRSEKLYRDLLKATGKSPERLFRFLVFLASNGESLRLGKIYREMVVLTDMPPQARELVAKLLGFCGWAGESTKIRQDLADTGYKLDTGMSDSLAFAKQSAAEIDDTATDLPVATVLRGMLTDFVNLETIGVEDEWVAARVGDAIRFFRQRGTNVVAVRSVATSRDDGLLGLLVNFYVSQTSEDASTAEWDMYGVMAELCPDLVDIEDVAFAVIGMELASADAQLVVKEDHAD